MQNKKMCILILLTATFFMIIAVFYIKQTQNKISKIEYIVDNSNLGSNIAIMVYDEAIQDYIQRNELPVGDVYRLNDEKTTCSSGGKILDYNNREGTLKYTLTTADECYVYIDEYLGVARSIMDMFVEQGTVVGDGKLYFHDSTLTNGANDNSYRFSGKNPNNYACFNGDDCTKDDNLYRIIGIVNGKAKLIKYTSLDRMLWNKTASNVWENSYVENYLNTTWLNNLGQKKDLIDESIWHVGGFSNYGTPKETLEYEMQSDIVVTRKIGLMYVSDYAFALDSNWASSISSNISTINNNWLYLGTNEWSISRYSANDYFAWYLYTSAKNTSNVSTNTYAVRPAFFLNESVMIKSGSGSKTDPWIMG